MAASQGLCYRNLKLAAGAGNRTQAFSPWPDTHSPWLVYFMVEKRMGTRGSSLGLGRSWRLTEQLVLVSHQGCWTEVARHKDVAPVSPRVLCRCPRSQWWQTPCPMEWMTVNVTQHADVSITSALMVQ